LTDTSVLESLLSNLWLGPDKGGRGPTGRTALPGHSDRATCWP